MTRKDYDEVIELNRIYNEDCLIGSDKIGSGSTAVSCINTNRNYIGFELDKGYFDAASARLAEHKAQQRFDLDLEK